MEKVDVIAEQIVGQKGAVRCVGKIVLGRRGGEIAGMQGVMIIGQVVSPEGGTLVLPENEGYDEMWECELIIMPRRKYSAHTYGKLDYAYNGYRADQILCADFGNPKCWGDKYFDINP